MAPTPLVPTDRYVPDGLTVAYWVEAIADISDPSRGEIDAGTDLTAELAAIEGWNLQSEGRDVQAAGEAFRSRVAGTIDVDGSALLLYADRSGDEIMSLFVRGTDGHILFLHGGDVEGNPMDVWPVSVAAASRALRIGGEPVRIQVQFVVTRQPALSVAAPA